MPNPRRGEIEAVLDGTAFNLVLTLGALAELEHAFGDTDMLALAERFQAGRLSARDAQRIIGAGLRAAGHDIAVALMGAEGGAAGFVDIVARLLAATFGDGGVRPSGSDTLTPAVASDAKAAPSSRASESGPADAVTAPSRQGVRPGGSDTVPFPGTT
jgi:hypothetical protein